MVTRLRWPPLMPRTMALPTCVSPHTYAHKSPSPALMASSVQLQFAINSSDISVDERHGDLRQAAKKTGGHSCTLKTWHTRKSGQHEQPRSNVQSATCLTSWCRVTGRLQCVSQQPTTSRACMHVTTRRAPGSQWYKMPSTPSLVHATSCFDVITLLVARTITAHTKMPTYTKSGLAIKC